MPFDLQDMIVRTREKRIKYFGSEIVFSYYVEKVTKEFKAEAVRLMRLSARLQRERNKLIQQLSEVEEAAVTGTIDDHAVQVMDDTMTDEVLKALDAEDTRIKHAIDDVVASIIATWDLTNKGEPYPPTAENLFPVDAALEGEMVSAILEDATPLGEGNGQQNMRLLPRTSKLKARQATSRQRRTI